MIYTLDYDGYVRPKILLWSRLGIVFGTMDIAGFDTRFHYALLWDTCLGCIALLFHSLQDVWFVRIIDIIGLIACNVKAGLCYFWILWIFMME